MNSTGKNLVLTTFGESHGPAVGGILDGFPSGIQIDNELILSELKRRSTGRSFFSSQRKEDDIPEILSGVYKGISTGAPIGFLVRNISHNPSDYDELESLFRPSHADYTWQIKFGMRDHRGGGRSSARETVARVIAGAFAKMLLKEYQIFIEGKVSSIGPFEASDENDEEITSFLEQLKKDGDTTGGTVSCIIRNVPPGLGEPVYDKLHASLGKAMLSINTVKGFEYGSGFAGSAMKGSEHNDIFESSGNRIFTRTNYSGGIQGGISNGMDIDFKVAFKPVPTLMQAQETIDKSGKKVTFRGKGRHDVCVVPRAVVIVEAMAALVIADHLMGFHPPRQAPAG